MLTVSHICNLTSLLPSTLIDLEANSTPTVTLYWPENSPFMQRMSMEDFPTPLYQMLYLVGLTLLSQTQLVHPSFPLYYMLSLFIITPSQLILSLQTYSQLTAMNSNSGSESDNSDEQFLSISRNTCTQPKQPKPKFTLLDDLDELNQMINGPGANQGNNEMKSVLQKAFKFGSTDKDDKNQEKHEHHQDFEQETKYYKKQRQSNKYPKHNQLQETKNEAMINRKKEKVNRTFEADEMSDEKQNSLAYMNQEKFNEKSKQIKEIKVPRIAIRRTEINLLLAPAVQDFYLTGLQNIEHLLQNNEMFVKGPRNSLKQKSGQYDLFGKALGQKKNGNHKHMKSDHPICLKNK